VMNNRGGGRCLVGFELVEMIGKSEKAREKHEFTS